MKYYDKNKDVLNYLKNMEMTDFGIIDFTNNDEEEKTIKVNGEDYFYSSITTTYSSNILYSGDFKFYISNSDNTVFLEKSKIANDYKFRAYAISAEDKETLLNLTKTKMVSDDGFYRVDGNPSDSKYTYYGDQNYIIGKRVIDWQNNNHDLVEGNNYFKGEFPDLVFKYNKNSGNVDVYKENEKLLTSNSIYIADVNQDEHFDLCVGYSIESKDGVNYGVYFYDIFNNKKIYTYDEGSNANYFINLDNKNYLNVEKCYKEFNYINHIECAYEFLKEQKDGVAYEPHYNLCAHNRSYFIKGFSVQNHSEDVKINEKISLDIYLLGTKGNDATIDNLLDSISLTTVDGKSIDFTGESKNNNEMYSLEFSIDKAGSYDIKIDCAGYNDKITLTVSE